MYAADRGLFSLQHVQPDTVGRAVQKMEQERVGGMEYLARRLQEDAALRPDVTVGQATDVLWMICSFDSFDSLYTDRGKSVEETVDLLVQTAERALCQEVGGSKQRRGSNVAMSCPAEGFSLPAGSSPLAGPWPPAAADRVTQRGRQPDRRHQAATR